MKILVTGGAGFIGSHLVDRLLKEGAKVLVLDDFSMGKHENLPKDNSNLVIFGGSVLDENVGFLFQGVNTVFHLAALTRPRESLIKPFETNKVNVEGTLKTLMYAKENEVKKFIFVSSASAYGYQKLYPFDERYPLNPASPYALTKSIGEQYCELFRNLYKMKINIVRPFNVYGKRQDPDSPYAAAVPNFIKSLKKGIKPYITGDGKQFRDFVYVKDVVDLLVTLSKTNLDGETFNVGSGTHTTISALYETLCGIMKKKVEPEYILPVNDPNTMAGVAKAESILGWKPKYSLIDGLLKTI